MKRLSIVGVALLATVVQSKFLTSEEISSFYPINPNNLRPTDGRAYLGARASNASLREAAAAIKGRSLRMGTAANAGDLANTTDVLYKATLSKEYDLITAENSCKWGPTEPTQGGFTFDKCTALRNYSATVATEFRGHNLCWGVYNPSWLTALHSATQLEPVLKNHVTTVITHYGTKVPLWDVVNEAVSDSGTETFKNTTWYPALPNYVDIAFTTARKAGPTTKLFYNDYSGEGMSAKSDKIYNMVSGMINRSIPIDGVGLQMHISVMRHPSFEDVEKNMQRLTALGLEVQVTEMDVRCDDEDERLFNEMLRTSAATTTCPQNNGCGCDWTKNGTRCGGDDGTECHCKCCCPYGGPNYKCEWKPPPHITCGSPQMLDMQSQVYGGMLQACLNVTKCTNFETWGFTDLHTWIWSFNNPHHKNLYPLPFDVDYKKKPAYFAMLDKLQKAALKNN